MEDKTHWDCYVKLKNMNVPLLQLNATGALLRITDGTRLSR